ncbi:MAG: DUF1573 domain-containing protein [Planctomycetes bacterium]|nr:DUF1573 domain-containing protein [Planctomycetota bacterium]
MKPVQLVLTVVFAVTALSLTVWLGKQQGEIPAISPAAATVGQTELTIPAQGPFGKAVATETTFDFGSLELGNSGSHVFVIKNEGQGPLRVRHGGTSCGQCTFGKVSPEDEDIPPGESAEVEVKWTIKVGAPKFHQSATVYTTDPNNKKLSFGIIGAVDQPLHMVPEGTWTTGDLSDKETTTLEGVLYSTLVDAIPIERAECASPLVKVTWEPMSKEELRKKTPSSSPMPSAQEKPALCGMKIKVQIDPATSVGPFRELVKLHTGVRDGLVLDIHLSGRRPGPIELKGPGVNIENNLVVLGEFPAETGKKSKIQMYVRNLDGELEATQLDPENGRVRVQVSSTGRTFGKSKVYDVEIEVPAGPPTKTDEKAAELVVLKLNHPTVSELKMYVDYNAR